MIDILIKNKAVESKQKKENFMDIEEDEISEIKYAKNINFDYKKVSEKYYKEKIIPFVKKHNPIQDKAKTLVTKNCGLKIQNYHVYQDDKGYLYNVNLSKVDIKKNLYGKFVYYHIQLLVNEKKQMYNLITHWGRFGDSGQYQNTPFTSLDEAIKEYNKIFSSKTKNNWEEIKNNFDKFEKKPKKYEILKFTDKKPEINNIMDYFNEELKNINIKVNTNSTNMNPNTKELLLYLIRITFSSKLKKYDSDDDKKFDFLYFSKESLEKGLKILNELAELNEKLNDLENKINGEKIYEKNLQDENSPYNRNKREYSEISHKILQLSNSYYEIIPFKEERNYAIEPIKDERTLKKEMDKIISYTYIEDTLKLFLSSLYYSNIMDPIDYIYKSLNKKIIPLNLDLKSENNKDKLLVKILRYYMRLYQKNRKTITNIFEIIDKDQNNLGNDIEKRILLFHGTKAENLLGILSKGLLIAPIEANFTGNRYGSGIYLSDSFWKALDYSYGEKKYVLVVDTLLDKPFKISKNNEFTNVRDLKKKKFNCLINYTRKHIGEERIYLFNGTTIPAFVTEEDDRYYYFSSGPEYVIYDPKLVNVKYIIELEGY